MPTVVAVDETALADARTVLDRMNCDPAHTDVEVGARICTRHDFYWPDDRDACNRFEDHELAALRLARAVTGAPSSTAPNVEALARYLHDQGGCQDPFGTCISTTEEYLDEARRLFGAGLIGRTEVEVKREALTEARKVISQYLATAEQWRYNRVLWAFGIMLGEIDKGTPEPPSPGDLQEQARQAEQRACGCLTHNPRLAGRIMVVCPTCGNKRCPRATFCGYLCTGSNEPNQEPRLA